MQTALLLAALAAAPTPAELPDPLRSWGPWVLQGHEAERCPFLAGGSAGTRCVWPAALDLALDDKAGRFTQ